MLFVFLTRRTSPGSAPDFIADEHGLLHSTGEHADASERSTDPVTGDDGAPKGLHPGAGPLDETRTQPRSSGAPAGNALFEGAPETKSRSRFGVVGGMAHIPRWLEARRHDLGFHVTCTCDEEFGTASRTWNLRAHLDAAGRYEMKNLRPGRYELRFVLDGASVSEPRRFILAAGQRRTDQDFNFVRQPTVSGRVYAALSALPLIAARIEVDSAPATRTDSRGRFTLYDLSVGVHNVLVRHSDQAPGHFTLVVPEHGAIPDVSWALGEGAQAKVLAMDRKGKPAVGLFVTLSGRDHMARAFTDAKGVARFQGLEPGATYTLRLPGFPSKRAPVTLVPEAERVREVQITWGR